MKALSKICLTSTKSDEITKAQNLLKRLEKFEFVFLLVLHTFILESVNPVSKQLQSKDADLFKAHEWLKNASDKLSHFRNHFNDAYIVAVSVAQEWGVTCEFQNKRHRKVTKHFGEIAEDERLSDPLKYFETAVFYGTLDIVLSQLKTRFEGLNNIIKLFELLNPKFLATATDKELTDRAKKLVSEYPEDIELTFPSELQSFRIALKDDIKACSTIKDLANFLFIENYSLACSVPDVCTSFLLFLTLPVTVATAERSFSKLTLIKNYLRSTMSQERLVGLSVLSIESDIARSIDVKEVVKVFVAKNARRQQYINK
ncbi:zinc finger MYM-type protein 1-like [Bemisia tabaci]|uniref:zinc finger MYM-type protein 1-like n=1 Tax=Bemisia tabaci TaxID=7038 RepID=UPI003B288AA7